jgi:peptidoglycan/xylan/chitin deacetylase (PgdA/CDA1 family)
VLVYRSPQLRIALLLALAAVLVACGAGEDASGPAGVEAAPEIDAAPDDAVEEPEPEPEPEEEPPTPAIDPAEVGADELGLVPVLMYHRLREDGTEYDNTPDEFREELIWLFDNGYRPIRTIDLVRGEIDVPAGTTPVVLTFDDSTREQAGLTPDGELEPETSMGILIEVASRYDDVDPVASLYVITSSLFGGTAAGSDVLVHLHELGMEIGNHTHTHPSLASLDAAGVQDELATNVAEVRALAGDAEVATLSLPLGVFPEDRSLVAQGSSSAGSYVNEGVLLVGSNPAPSPFAAEFDPLAIPRIRSSPNWDGGEPDFGSRFWLEQLERGATYRRYVSDGDPETISFPADRAGELHERFADRANPY